LAAVGLALVFCIGIARVGNAALLQSRADTAADAAALAGADVLAVGGSAEAAIRAARAAAASDRARLVSCSCEGAAAEVVVMIGRAHGHARADVDLSREPQLGP
jgi:hypothetical protein